MMRHRLKLRVRVPATTSNLGPGFDVLGMALKLYCELELTLWWLGSPLAPGEAAARTSEAALPRGIARSADPQAAGSLKVDLAGEGSDVLPADATNLVVRSFREVLPADDFPHPMRFRITNGIPIERGLGSSAAARLCGLLAAGAVYDFEAPGLSPDHLIELACRREGHPDNVVPAFFGGLQASLWDGDRILHFALRLPKDLGVVVCVPEFRVSTEEARKVLPKKVPREHAVATSSRLAFLLGALERGEYSWLKVAMKDVIHQPYRRKLVRGMDAVIRAAEGAGAFGAALSGSGSSVLALTLRGTKQAKVGRAMQKAFSRYGAESRVLPLDVDREGARIRGEL